MKLDGIGKLEDGHGVIEDKVTNENNYNKNKNNISSDFVRLIQAYHALLCPLCAVRARRRRYEDSIVHTLLTK